MVRSQPVPLLVPVVAAMAALLSACAAPPAYDFARATLDTPISIDITGCYTDQIGIAVRPWTALVAPGDTVRWSTPAAVDSVAIEAIDPAHWPFRWADGQQQEQPVQRRVALGGDSIQAGVVPLDAPIGEVYRYRILVYCELRVIDIDPDVMIEDPR